MFFKVTSKTSRYLDHPRVSNFSPKRAVFGGFFGTQISDPTGGFRWVISFSLQTSNQHPNTSQHPNRRLGKTEVLCRLREWKFVPNYLLPSCSRNAETPKTQKRVCVWLVVSFLFFFPDHSLERNKKMEKCTFIHYFHIHLFSNIGFMVVNFLQRNPE